MIIIMIWKTKKENMRCDLTARFKQQLPDDISIDVPLLTIHKTTMLQVATAMQRAETSTCKNG